MPLAMASISHGLLLAATYVLAIMCAGSVAARGALPLPSSEQLSYMENEISMFMHYSVCTCELGRRYLSAGLQVVLADLL